MRKSLWLVVGVLFVAIVAPNAHADNITPYTINFTLASGSPLPGSGSFDYDSTTPGFTNFNATWNGNTYDLTSSANNPLIVGSQACLGGASGAAATFQLLTNCGNASWNGDSGNYNFDPYSANLLIEAVTDSSNYIVVEQYANGNGNPLGGNGQTIDAQGTFTLSGPPTATPESGTLDLMLVGLGILGFVMRRHIAQGLPLAS